MKYITGKSEPRKWTAAEKRLIEEAILLEQVPQDTNIYHKIALFLKKATGVDYVTIGLKVKEDNKLIRTLAFYKKGKVLENLTYNTNHTPCEHVLGRNFIYFPANLQELFPLDTYLQQINVHSYMAVPLTDEDDETIGLISLMHTGKFARPELAEHLLFMMARLLEENLVY